MSYWKFLPVLLLLFLTGTTVSDVLAQLRLEENRGQWPEQVLFRAKMKGGGIFFERDRLTFHFMHHHDWDAFYAHHHGPGDSHDGHDHSAGGPIRWHSWQVVFEGASRNLEVVPEGLQQGYTNYFIGNNPKLWASGVRGFSKLTYLNVWPGISLEFYQDGDHLKYDIHLVPGAKPEQVRLRYDDVDDLSIQGRELVTTTSVTALTESIPKAWQEVKGKQHDIPFRFVLKGRHVSFEALDDFDSRYPLVIDPTLIFGSYTGSTADNFGFTATYGPDEKLFGGGIVFGAGYPVTVGAYQTVFRGGVDVAITKWNAAGTGLEFSTYLGGSSDETPNSIVVNEQGECFIYGVTGSPNFPITTGAYQAVFRGGPAVSFPSNGTTFGNGTDMYVSRLSADGTQLLASTFVGGSGNDGVNDGQTGTFGTLTYNYGDMFRGEIIVDDNSNVFVASCTQSSNFPTSAGAPQSALVGLQSAVVFSLNSNLTNLRWSTYLGGSAVDAAYSVKLGASGSVYAAGGTASSNFPVTTNAHRTAYQGGQADGFITQINATGTQILASTYTGTGQYDQNYFVETDVAGKIFVIGQTTGLFPVSPGVYSNPNSGQYIARYSTDLSTLERSTVFGKGDFNPDISPTAFLVDRCNNVYVSGWGGATQQFSQNPDINISGMPLTGDAFQSTTNGSDFYFFVLDEDMQQLLYATYFGGTVSEEHVDGGTSRFDKRGAIYQAVCAGCRGNSDFPTTPGAWSQTNNSTNCNLGVVKFDLDLIDVEALAAISGDATGCAPLTVQFLNQGSQNVSYEWDFGDGTTSNAENPLHVFTSPGTYTIRFTVEDTTSTCKIPDTSFVTVIVLDSIQADFSYSPDTISVGTLIQFTDLTANSLGWLWDFGDGNTSNNQHPVHSYSEPGTYKVCLTVQNNTCTDSICKFIHIPLIDVPTAFSPNGDGINDVLYVRGIGVVELVFRVYNRWGQLVFETTDLNRGWNGTFNGQPQEQEVYVFTLEALLENQLVVNKKGNITLIR